MIDATGSEGPSHDRPRVLFVTESFTLAHLARLLALAKGLPTHRYESVLAAAERFRPMAAGSPIRWRPFEASIPPEQFLDSLLQARPFHDFNSLQAAVEADLRLMDEVRPDLIVGDFRLSLATSARVARIPFATITNAYWSPYAARVYPLPEIPLSHRLGPTLGGAVFRIFGPLAFKAFARDYNRLQRTYGLKGSAGDMRQVHCDADHTLYADAPELVPTANLPGHHHYLGPVLWSPDLPVPSWWNAIPDDRPLIYATPGSSGRGALLPNVLAGLADLPVRVLAATAGKPLPSPVPSNALVADFLPGIEAAQRSVLVIGNGGSPTSQQGLAAGVPVLGLASNLDQHLNMHHVVASGAGRLLRAEAATPDRIRATVQELLENRDTQSAASTLGKVLRSYDAPATFRKIAEKILGLAPGRAGD